MKTHEYNKIREHLQQPREIRNVGYPEKALAKLSLRNDECTIQVPYDGVTVNMQQAFANAMKEWHSLCDNIIKYAPGLSQLQMVVGFDRDDVKHCRTDFDWLTVTFRHVPYDNDSIGAQEQ